MKNQLEAVRGFEKHVSKLENELKSVHTREFTKQMREQNLAKIKFLKRQINSTLKRIPSSLTKPSR